MFNNNIHKVCVYVYDNIQQLYFATLKFPVNILEFFFSKFLF